MGRIADRLRQQLNELKAEDEAIRQEEQSLLTDILREQRMAQAFIDHIDRTGWEA